MLKSFRSRHGVKNLCNQFVEVGRKIWWRYILSYSHFVVDIIEGPRIFSRRPNFLPLQETAPSGRNDWIVSRFFFLFTFISALLVPSISFGRLAIKIQEFFFLTRRKKINAWIIIFRERLPAKCEFVNESVTAVMPRMQKKRKNRDKGRVSIKKKKK